MHALTLSTSAFTPRSSRPLRWLRDGLAIVGLAALVGFGTALVTDVRAIDDTSGAYEAPYTGWTGTPIDWSRGAVTSTGIVGRGHVLDTTLDCTTGMFGFELLGFPFDYRTVSPRALAIHRPREACAARGFRPEF